MKKIATLVAVLLAVTSLSAQKTAVNSAYTHYGNEYWDKAKRAIDMAIENPETKDDAKTWMYRGNIYLMIANTKVERYKNLCDNPLDVAYEAYMKAMQLDPKIQVQMRISKPEFGLKYCSDMFFNKAIEAMNVGKYADAVPYAEKAYNCNKKAQDPAYLYGLSLEMAGDKDKAKDIYSVLVKSGTRKPEPYMRLSSLYKDDNDTARAVKVISLRSILKDTSSKVNVDYATREALIYAWAGDVEKSTEVMNKALSFDPNNYTMLVNMGSELTEQKKYAEAEKLLLRANSVKENDFFILYNLGNCYYNSYVDLFKKMDSIEEDKEYKKAQDSCQVLLRKALPFLEQALSLDGDDHNTLLMLKLVYPRIDAKDGEDFEPKRQAVEAKLEAEQH